MAIQAVVEPVDGAIRSLEAIPGVAFAGRQRGAAGDTGDAYYYMSEYHISSGDLMLATQQLDLALASPDLTDVQRKRFQARREEIRGYLREQRNDRSGRTPPAG